jgi:hypothetical protein
MFNVLEEDLKDSIQRVDKLGLHKNHFCSLDIDLISSCYSRVPLHQNQCKIEESMCQIRERKVCSCYVATDNCFLHFLCSTDVCFQMKTILNTVEKD